MKTFAPYLSLCLRVALAWWLVLVVVSAIAFGPFALIGAVFLFPALSIAVGGWAAWRQYRGLAPNLAGRSPLAVGHRETVGLALQAAQAARLARSSVESVFGQVEQRVTERAVYARVMERGVKATGLAALRSDQLTITVIDDGTGRSTLEIACEPLHSWLYGWFWVDAGRCARQVERFRQSIISRVRAQGELADTIARKSSLESRLAQAELLLLRAQIEPHFLFNTLAHIRASIIPDPLTASAMLDALIDFLRANSQTASRADIQLADELHRVESYLKIIQIRLGERLRYAIESEPALSLLHVPTACVLVLAENAVKHGIERSGQPGIISVRCQRVAGAIEIQVCNDGPALAMRPIAGAGGLGNLRDRLHLAYGEAASMSIEDREEGGVCASLRIPVIGQGDDA